MTPSKGSQVGVQNLFPATDGMLNVHFIDPKCLHDLASLCIVDFHRSSPLTLLLNYGQDTSIFHLQGNSTNFAKLLIQWFRCKRNHSEWFSAKCAFLEKFTKSELFTIIVLGTRCLIQHQHQHQFLFTIYFYSFTYLAVLPIFVSSVWRTLWV